MSNNRLPSDGGYEERALNSTRRKRFDRRDCLKFAGAAVVAGFGATSTASAASYETITVPSNDQEIVRVEDGETLENKIYDVTANDASLRMVATGSDWTVRNIGVRGQNRDDDDFPYTIAAGVDEGSIGIIENVYLGDGAAPEKGSIAIKVTLPHAGTLTIRNCYIEDWPANGIYGAAPGRDPPDKQGGNGAVQIEQCYARNNNLSNYRISDNSYVRDSVVHVDEDVGYGYENPEKVNARGIWVKEGGDCEISNCDVLLEHPDASYCIVEYDEEEEGTARVSDVSCLPAMARRASSDPTAVI